MRPFYAYLLRPTLALMLSMALAPSLQAHLMPAQQGTLNIVDDGAYLVLSLPVSAFEGIDDDNDGRVSPLEFNLHRGAILESVRQHVKLSDNQGPRPLQGLMLSPVLSHNQPTETLTQLTVMGRFTLAEQTNALRFQLGLYGQQAAEKVFEITASRRSESQQHAFELTPETTAARLFSIPANHHSKN